MEKGRIWGGQKGEIGDKYDYIIYTYENVITKLIVM